MGSRFPSLLERNGEPPKDSLHRAVVCLQCAFEFPAVCPVDFLVQLFDLLLQRVAQELGFLPTEFDCMASTFPRLVWL